MPDYRRHRLPGGSYFFTVNLLERKSDLLIRHVDVLRDAVRHVRQSSPFHIDAWVILPDHMHCIWTLPPGDADYSSRWKAIKIQFAKAMPAVEYRSRVRIARGERGIWQRRFWEHTLRDEQDYAAYMDYVHINPVKHGLVSQVRVWPHSSFHRYAALGLYPEDWAGIVDDLEAGEPGR